MSNLPTKRIKRILKEHGINCIRIPNSNTIIAQDETSKDGFTDVTRYSLAKLGLFLGYEPEQIE